MKSLRPSPKVLIGVCLLGIIGLIQVHPIRFYEPDEICYYFSSRNFALGKWYLTDSELSLQREEALRLSPLWPHDLGYVRYKDRYVLIKAPGYSLYLALLQFLHLERLANVFLILLSVGALCWLCGTYCKSSITLTSVMLLLFTPISVVMMYRVYMSDIASSTFLLLGGVGLILSTGPKQWPVIRGYILTGMSGLVLGIAIVMRFTNSIAVMLLLGVYVLFLLRQRSEAVTSKRILSSVLVLGLGFSAPLFCLIVYNVTVFGHFFEIGYLLQTIRPQDTTFIVQQMYLGCWPNVPETILRNVTVLPEIIISGIPWFILVPPALVWGYRNMDRRLYTFLSVWIAGILLVYLQYRMLMPHIFVIILRMYLPLVAPAAILSALYLDHLGKSVGKWVCFFSGLISLLFFIFFLYLLEIPFLGLHSSASFGSLQDVPVFSILRQDEIRA